MTDVIPDEKLKGLLNVLYNVFFRKWSKKGPVLTTDEWGELLDEANRIWEQGQQYPLVGTLVKAFVSELEARSIGAYPDKKKF